MARSFDSRLRVKTDYLAALTLTLAPLLYFSPVLLKHGVLCPDDGILQNIPLRIVIAHMIRSGYVPLWNPYIFSGMPLLAAAQGGVLFPLNWFYLEFSPMTATNLSVLATCALAGVGGYFYARRAGASIAGALVTGVIWQWSGFMVAQIGHINVVQTATLLPWLLWAIDGFGKTGNRFEGALVAAIVALQVFAGHQQTLVYSLSLALAYAAVMAFATSKPMRRRYLGSLTLIAAGLSLSAAQILPTGESMRKGIRASASYDFFSSFSLPPRFLLTFLAPFVVGGGDGRLFTAPYTGVPFYGEYIGYVGLLAIGLGVISLRFFPDTRTKFWAGVAAVALLLALGRFLLLGVYRLIYYIPVINLFLVPARHLMEFDFAVAVLAGRGVAAVFAAKNSREMKRWTLAVGASIFLLTCLTVTAWRPVEFRLLRDAPASLLRAPELFVPPIIAAFSALALWIFARTPNRLAMICLFAVMLVDLSLWGQSSGWRRKGSCPLRESAYWREPISMKFLREPLDHDELFRVLTVPQSLDPNAQAGRSDSLTNSSRHCSLMFI